MAKSNPRARNQAAQKPSPQTRVARPAASKQTPDTPALDGHFAPGFWKKWWPAALVIAALAAGLYWQALPYEYILDDQMVITNNQYTKKGIQGIGDIFSHETFQGYFGEQKDLVVGARYRPLSLATFAIEYQIFGLNPKVGHFGNMILYILTGLLLLRIFSLFFRDDAEQKWYWSIPFAASVLFILHPVHTEVVANIKGRDEIMTLLGALCSLYLSFRYLKDRKNIWLIFSGIIFFLALLAKENALTFIAVIPVSIWFFTKAKAGDLWKTTLPLLVSTVVYLIIRYQVIGYFLNSGKEVKLLMNDPFLGMTAIEKFSTIFYTLLLYIKLLFFPHPLTHDYYPYQIPKMSPGDWQVWLALVVYAGLIYVMIKNWKRKQVLAYSIAFFLLTLSITSNLVFPVGTFMNERFIYASSIGWCLFMGWLAVRYLPAFKPQLRIAGIALVALFSLGFAYKSYDRIPAWANTMALNKAAVRVSTNSARANSFMSTSLFEAYRVEKNAMKGEQYLNEALPYMRRALEIVPDYNDALTMKAGISAELFKYHHNLDTLFKNFKEVLYYAPGQAYIKEYMLYLNKNEAYKSKLIPFYLSVGDMLANERNKPDYAMMYLDMGRQLDPNNQAILAAMQQTNLKISGAQPATPVNPQIQGQPKIENGTLEINLDE